MGHPIAYDFSRLASRIFSKTPNGIDRVDMAYARHLLTEGGEQDCGILYLGPFDMRVVGHQDATRAIHGIDIHFGERSGSVDASFLQAVTNWSRGNRNIASVSATSFQQGQRTSLAKIADYTIRTIASAGKRAVTALPKHARYVCVSQFPLSEWGAYDWLKHRPDVKAVFFIHDLLPLQYPEYFLPPERTRHQRRLEQLARVGSGALVSTRVVAEDLRHELQRLGRRDFPIFIAPMPLESSFSPGPIAHELSGIHPYFIQCGTIEPRKNHLTMLHVWRELFRELGTRTPKLILVGARGWENENVVDLLDRSPAIRENVLQLQNVATPTLVELIRGAKALLMPSFGEGYGLPIAEAIALGVPVIASDIPVFHEITGGNFHAVDPIDAKGWRSAILTYLTHPLPDWRVVSQTQRPHFTSVFKALRGFIDSL